MSDGYLNKAQGYTTFRLIKDANTFFLVQTFIK